MNIKCPATINIPDKNKDRGGVAVLLGIETTEIKTTGEGKSTIARDQDQGRKRVIRANIDTRIVSMIMGKMIGDQSEGIMIREERLTTEEGLQVKKERKVMREEPAKATIVTMKTGRVEIITKEMIVEREGTAAHLQAVVAVEAHLQGIIKKRIIDITRGQATGERREGKIEERDIIIEISNKSHHKQARNIATKKKGEKKERNIRSQRPSHLLHLQLLLASKILSLITTNRNNSRDIKMKSLQNKFVCRLNMKTQWLRSNRNQRRNI